MSFSFGTPKTDANTTGGFSFGTVGNSGAGDAKAGTAKPFGFGAGFNIGGVFPPTTASTGRVGATSGTLNLTAPTANAPISSTFNLGSTPSSVGISQGVIVPTTATGFGLGITNAQNTSLKLVGTTTSSTTLNLSTTTASSTGFGLLGTPKTIGLVPTAAGFTLSTNSNAPVNVTTTTTTASSFGFGSTTTANTTTSTTLGFPQAGGAKTTAFTGFSLTAPAIATSVATSTASAIPASGNLNFGQLVDAINKWTIDLEEQGKLFSNQAKQLNAWDRLLVSNGEKVLSLNSGIERVKQQQQQLDQELDFVLAQQKELEDLITPLEKELSDIPLTDVDRIHTYQLAENMDTQLKQMSEDLKEIIEQLNESNKSLENSNPITQIRKILNAHMDSLQWIDRHTAKITGHLDQISKMNDLHRKSHEHSLKKTYD